MGLFGVFIRDMTAKDWVAAYAAIISTTTLIWQMWTHFPRKPNLTCQAKFQRYDPTIKADFLNSGGASIEVRECYAKQFKGIGDPNKEPPPKEIHLITNAGELPFSLGPHARRELTLSIPIPYHESLTAPRLFDIERDAQLIVYVSSSFNPLRYRIERVIESRDQTETPH